MDYTTFVEHVRADGLRLSEAAGAAGMQAAVPSCPGWLVDDLVRHIAQVYEHKIACTALGKAPDPWPPDWPADRDPVEWFGD
ncbi:MAG TPA: maleylpyruvate isomerase N-terminal domain-containing protein, partial [Actinomycetota bacterium]